MDGGILRQDTTPPVRVEAEAQQVMDRAQATAAASISLLAGLRAAISENQALIEGSRRLAYEGRALLALL